MKIFDYALIVDARNMIIPQDLIHTTLNNPLLVVIVGGCNADLEEYIERIWFHNPNISFVFPPDSSGYSFLDLAREIYISKKMLDGGNVIKNLNQKPYKVLG